ncbi:hypothetical protein F2Q69_00009339 [Brassica cretica]|uniref:Uncharacterized protein n=1 Tax=Brassica cretica TaxID=69181 RepID=A0A8S9PCG3_BRACR|nr:hypothetical protein F2Q69_00009339 [Brassica cretica]
MWKGRFLGFGAGPFSVSRSASGLSLCRELRLVFFFVNGGSVLDHVCSGDSPRRKRVLSGRVQAEMADLSVQTCVVSLEGFNQLSRLLLLIVSLVLCVYARSVDTGVETLQLGIVPLVLKGRTWRVGSRESLTGSVLRPSRSGVVVNPTRLCSYGGGSGECLLAPHRRYQLHALWSSSEASYTVDDMGIPGIRGNEENLTFP